MNRDIGTICPDTANKYCCHLSPAEQGYTLRIANCSAYEKFHRFLFSRISS
jgi:hypothetical protein